LAFFLLQVLSFDEIPRPIEVPLTSSVLGWEAGMEPARAGELEEGFAVMFRACTAASDTLRPHDICTDTPRPECICPGTRRLDAIVSIG
jgi:hypothetical protein